MFIKQTYYTGNIKNVCTIQYRLFFIINIVINNFFFFLISIGNKIKKLKNVKYKSQLFIKSMVWLEPYDMIDAFHNNI